MYRKDGFCTPADSRYGYSGYRFSRDKEGTDSKYHDRDKDKDVYIRSRTFQNSNWRQPLPPPPPAPAWERASAQFDQTHRREIAAVNNCFMPHFCSKKESSYTPTLKAVDNLTPKFLSLDISSETSVQSQTQALQQQPDGKNRSAQAGTSPKSQSSSVNSWRKQSPCSENSSGLTIRRKFHLGLRLSAVEREELFMPKTLMEMLGSKRSLYETMNNLNTKTMKVQMDDFQKQEMACEHVRSELQHLYPDNNVIPYGTRRLGMAHPEAAIYMFFDSGNGCYHQASNHRKDLQTQIRQTVFQTLKKCGHCSEVTDWDRQELVTFRHLESEMNCVVSFCNGFKDQNTLLLKTFLKIDKRLRLLTLLVTDMVYRYHDISKHFTSYVLNVMLIMYLQRLPDPVLPTLQKLRGSFQYEKVFIGDFDCGHPREFSLPATNNDQSVETLLKGFCAFYREFNYRENVISIIGPELKRSMFCPPFNLTVPEEPLHSFLIALKKGDIPKINCDLPVIVQDPFELNCNAAEKVNSTVLEVFIMMCADAYEILSRWC